jgi:hypothetical protein
MTSELKRIIKYNKERNELLMSGDIVRLTVFYRKHNPGAPEFSSPEVAEIMLHKARTAIRSLPMKYRVESKKWLDERGYRSMDDGDL